MGTPIRLETQTLRMEVDAENGAGVGSLHARIGGRWLRVCVPDSSGRNGGALGSGLFLMLPFANRARGNRITDGDRHWALEPNTNEPLALHGTGWERPWRVDEEERAGCTLSLKVRERYPFGFDASHAVWLEGQSAHFRLAMTNCNDFAIPAGLGFHPWFPRQPGTMVRFGARFRWLEGPDHLPTHPAPADRDAGTPLPLSPDWQNDCFTGWDRKAAVLQGDAGYGVDVSATSGLSSLMLFSTRDLDRFALEPQSHLSGATYVGSDGLRRLAPGETWSESMTLTIGEILSNRVSA